MIMAQQFYNHIDGKWLAAKSAKNFENRNPAKRDDLTVYSPLRESRCRRSIACCQESLRQLALVPAPKRGDSTASASC
jgi:acyl-CoA reductase-like NAD-dependent aldehyde dehydrogenase